MSPISFVPKNCLLRHKHELNYDTRKILWHTEQKMVTAHLSYQPTDTSRRCIFSGYSPKAETLVLSASNAWE